MVGGAPTPEGLIQQISGGALRIHISNKLPLRLLYWSREPHFWDMTLYL